MKKKYALSLAASSAVLLCLIVLIGCTEKSDTYEHASAWAYYAEGENRKADLFLVCPTVDMGRSGNLNMSLDDEKTKSNFIGALNMERGIYENSARMYAPFYRQMTFPGYSLPPEEREKYLQIAYADVRKAFIHFAKVTGQSPIILAGFSQGSDMVIRLLKEFFDDENLSRRLVAGYCIGWKLTEDELREFPHLSPARGETDTGCIIVFNSESHGVRDSLLIPSGTRSICINPLNWRTDSVPAHSSMHLGACFTDYKGAITREVAAFCGARIDPARGSLIADGIDPKEYANPLFPQGVYHIYDYQFFFRNLQKNVQDRLDAFLRENADRK